MKIISMFISVILISCQGSGGGGSSSGGSKTTVNESEKSFLFFNANLTGTKSLYMTNSIDESPTMISQEVSFYTKVGNGYIMYVKENGSNEDTPYLYNYKDRTTVNIREELGISAGTDMNMSNYSLSEGDDTVSFSVLSFLCDDDSSSKVCTISLASSYKIEKHTYSGSYLGAQVINNKVSICYFSSTLNCLVSGYNNFSKDISFFVLNVPNPATSWDHIDSISSFDNHFLVKGGTDSDDKYYVYSSSYSYLRTTSIVNKSFVVISGSGTDLLIQGDLDGESRYWEFNYLTDSLVKVFEGDGIVSPNFIHYGEDDTFYYISINKNNEGSELYRVNKSNWSEVRLTDSTGSNSSNVESFNEGYAVVVENSSRTIYVNNSGSLSTVSLTYDNSQPLVILSKLNGKLLFLGASVTYDNILMYLESDLKEYEEVRGNSNDPDISGVLFN